MSRCRIKGWEGLILEREEERESNFLMGLGLEVEQGNLLALQESPP